MKRRLCFWLLSPVLLSAVGCGPSNGKRVDVVIISGQSNATGCSHSELLTASMGEEKHAEFLMGYEDIQIAYDCWTKDFPAGGGYTFFSQNTSLHNDFVKVELGQGNGIGTFGPEIGIAESMHEKYGNKLFLIKFACGASNLKDDWAKRNSPMYSKLIDYVKLQMNNLTKKGYAPTIKAFCWMQGEGDSYPNYHNVYLDNLREFVSNIRTDLKKLAGNKELPFIDAGISNASLWQYWRQVNSAKMTFAEESENNIYINTIAAGLHTNREPYYNIDEAHYDSDSEVLLGRLFAREFERFLEPVE